MITLRRFLAVLLLVPACHDEPPTTAQFVVPRAGQLAADADFFSLPFPSDFWRTDAGLDLSLYPRSSALVEDYLDAMASRLDGFGNNSAIYVRFDRAIDTATLPATPDAARDDAAAAVYLVDVDADSPDRGARWPLRFRFEPREGETIGTNWLAALPYPGFPLAEGRTYALVVTSRLHGADGSPVLAGDDWEAIAADLPVDDQDLQRAQSITQPLLDYLDDPGGDERADVVTAAVFTTQRSTDMMAKLRERVWELDTPAVSDIVRIATHDEYLTYDAVYTAPNFQSGNAPYTSSGGEIELDEVDGLPIVQRDESMRMSFTIPTGEMPPEGWPIALYAHGTGGSFHSYEQDGTALRLAAQGLAVMSIDQVLHGPRNPGASPEISFFNFQNPLAARDNTIQGAADNFSLVRVALDFVFDEPPTKTPADPGRHIEFNDQKLYFFGHSQGGLTGPPFVAYEPEVQGAVLSGAGGLLYLAVLHKTEPLDITQIVGALIRDEPLDEFSPTLALLQTWIERSDPVNYGPMLAREPVVDPDGDGTTLIPPRPIFQTEGLIDSYAPPVGIEALAVSIGGHMVGPVLQDVPGFALRDHEVLEAPVTGNLDGTTVVLLQYNESSGSDGHFVVFDVPAAEVQSAEFLGTLAASGAATVVEP